MSRSETKQEVIKQWEDTPVEDHKERLLNSFYTDLTVNKITELADIDSKSKVLEAGSGWGRIAAHMSKEFSDLTSIDITEEMIIEQSRIVPSANQLVADAEHLPFKSDLFDMSYAIRMLHYFDDIGPFVNELMRVTAPGQPVIFVQPNRYNPYHRLTYYTRLLSPKEVVRAFRDCGVTDIQIEHFGFSHPNKPIPALEYMHYIPLIRKMSGYFLIRGVAPS